VKALLLLVYAVIGSLYLYEWGAASNRCHEKWLMLTPFWVFMPSKFTSEGLEHVKRARIYLVLGFLGLIPVAMYLEWL
jgi:hypothetical protein